MIYLSGSVSREAMLAGEIGLMLTPHTNHDLSALPSVAWAADNGCFADRWVEGPWWAWLERNAWFAGSCLFAVAPDVVGDAVATAERSAPWLARIRNLGYPVAYVAQDGLEDSSPPPWEEINWLFIGGSTEWKTSDPARRLALEAQGRGKKVHMGRVNSSRRLVLASWWGCDSADGTFLKYGPDKNLPRLRRMLAKANSGFLFDAAGRPCD